MGQTRYNVGEAAACGIITQAETAGVLKKTADLDSGPLTFSITASVPEINCFLQVPQKSPTLPEKELYLSCKKILLTLEDLQHIEFAKKGGSITSDLQLAEYGAMSTFEIHVMSGKESPK